RTKPHAAHRRLYRGHDRPLRVDRARQIFQNDAGASLVASPDREVDLVVAGAGPAGMTAALVASLEGLDVLLCEKSGQVGGTGATSAGTLWIPGNSQNKKAGYDDGAEQADKYLSGLIGEDTL